ncbi:uncharacterized protein LOC109539889 [Dendroctonus ponderosae]
MYYFAHFLVFSITSLLVSGQEYTVLPVSIEKCKVHGDNELSYNVGLTDQDGTKTFSIEAELSSTLNESCTFSADVDLWSGSQYNHYMNADGSACESIENMLKSAWGRFKSNLEPSVEDSCTFKPGKYSISEFQVSSGEINVPIPSKGLFKAHVHLVCDKSEVVCLTVEFEVIEDED